MTKEYVPSIERDDKGCSLAPKCLECPFDLCRYDTGNPGVKPMQGTAIRRARRDGASVDELCQRWRLSKRHVQRILAEGRERQPAVSASA